MMFVGGCADGSSEMPRRARIVLAETAHHVVARGANRQKLFHCRQDKTRYLELLAKLAKEEDVSVHGYVLMNNHVHMILTPKTRHGLARLFNRLHTRWAMYINRKYQRTGHLFENRYFSSPLGASHFWAAIRYVELNPRKAKWNGPLEQWIHSSARAHLSGVQSPLIALEWETWRFRFKPVEWKRFLEDGESILREQWEEQGRDLERALAGGRPVGDPDWIANLEQTWKRKLTWSPPGRPRIPVVHVRDKA